MATVIKTEPKKATQSNYRVYGKKEQTPKTPLFKLPNYILMGVGLVIAFVGYILLTGGGSKDPNVFSPDIFDTRRLVVAPCTILAGLIIEIFAIMLRFPDTNDMKKDNQPAEQ